MKKYLFPLFGFIIFVPPVFAGPLTKTEQCKYITETMLEIAAQGATVETLRKLQSREIYEKAFSSCMTGSEDEVSELYKRLQ